MTELLEKSIQTLELPRVLAMLADEAVTEEGKVVGIITLGDIALSQAYDMEASKTLADISDNIKRR